MFGIHLSSLLHLKKPGLQASLICSIESLSTYGCENLFSLGFSSFSWRSSEFISSLHFGEKVRSSRATDPQYGICAVIFI